MVATWEKPATKRLYNESPLHVIVKMDRVAVEAARRLLVFREGKDYKKVATTGSCFLLMTWGASTRALKSRKIPHRDGWIRQNEKIWVNITPEYFDVAVAPIIARFTKDELQRAMFSDSFLQNYQLVALK